MTAHRADIAIVGGGIAGLAHAYAAAKRGRKVVLFERHAAARGASVRNFGMIWPIGQPPGAMHDIALRSRELWLQILEAARLPYFATGSLHAARHADEAAVCEEFAERGPSRGYDCRWLSASEALAKSPALIAEGLAGALWSPAEITVDPRLVVATLPAFLAEKYGVELHYGCPVRSIDLPRVETSEGTWEVGRAVVCGGDLFESLYPQVWRAAGLTRCKLQMMRTAAQPGGWGLGPALAGGLSLRYYPTFQICPSLAALKRRIAHELPQYDKWGIHVMLSQTARGEITIGDSHEYGAEPDVFDKPEIDECILSYLRHFVRLPDAVIAERWHGIYAKHPSAQYLSLDAEGGARIVVVTSGVGMTLSFGLAEQVIGEMELA